MGGVHSIFKDLEDEIIELKKEIAALRRALLSHGQIIEENARLKSQLRQALSEIPWTNKNEESR